MYFFVKLRFVWIQTFLVTFLCYWVIISGDKCPTQCFCKWKSGKQTVECIEKGLISIPENIDVETQVFDFSGNNLQTLPRETFSRFGLINLQRLVLKSCKIGLIDALSFKGIVNLIELNLSNNLLTSVPSNVFRDVPYLRELILSHNPIQKIKPFAFGNIHGLMKLDLSNCEIQTIDPRAFEGIEMLEYLKLHENRLFELFPGTLTVLNRLHVLELYSNPWYCDCRLRSLKEWLTKTNLLYSNAPECLGGPERLIHKSFKELNIIEFACKPEFLQTSRYIETTFENNATVVCKSNAIPPANIKWFWNGKQLLNNSMNALSTKITIFEEGFQEKTSTLTLINIREEDVYEFYCLSENRAGNIETNFTLLVAKNRNLINLESAHLAGLGAALVLLFFSIIIIVSLVLIRLRRKIESTKVNDQQTLTGKRDNDVSSGLPNVVAFCKSDNNVASNIYGPEQKYTYSSDISYSTVHYNGNGSITSEFVVPISSENVTLCENSLVDLISENNFNSTDTTFAARDYGEKGSNNYATHNHYLPSDGNPSELNINQDNLLVGDLMSTAKIINYPPDYGLPILNSPETTGRRVVSRNEKILQICHRGAIPVLPSITAIKKSFLHKAHSPDEGFQEGCSTDV